MGHEACYGNLDYLEFLKGNWAKGCLLVPLMKHPLYAEIYNTLWKDIKEIEPNDYCVIILLFELIFEFYTIQESQ